MIGVYIPIILCLPYVVQNIYASDEVSDLIPLITGTTEKIKEKGEQNFNTTMSKDVNEDEKVNIRLYYECHCPFCMRLAQNKLKDVVNVLGSHLDIKFYPYGNAETTEENGKVEFECQHGPEECYGNKLHACALKHIGNHTKALLFNICMMQVDEDSIGSDDAAVSKCAKEMDLGDFENPIKICATSDEGDQLLKYYGEETEKESFRGVPYMLINGVRFQHGTADLLHDVCALFKNPPEACQQQNNTTSTSTPTSTSTSSS